MSHLDTNIWKKKLNLWQSILKILSEYICRLPSSTWDKKWNWHFIRNYLLNVFKCLTVSVFPLTFFLWQLHHFCLFRLAFSVNLLSFLSLKEKEVHSTSRGDKLHSTSSSTSRGFIPLSAFILLCLGITSKIYYCKKIALSLVLLVSTFDKVIFELQKTQRIELWPVMMLVIRPSSPWSKF